MLHDLSQLSPGREGAACNIKIGDELYPGCKNKSAPPSTSESEPNRYLLEAVLSASGFFVTALTTGGFGVQKSPPVFANSLGT